MLTLKKIAYSQFSVLSYLTNHNVKTSLGFYASNL